MATLRAVTSAQAQFQASSKADIDLDGNGEFGSFKELSGGVDVRNDTTVGTLNPPVLSSAFRVPDTSGLVSRSGYHFKIYLTSSDGTGINVDGSADNWGSIDPDLSETTWACYAWPVFYGSSGTRTFMVNQTGDIVHTEESTYSKDSGPPAHAAFVDGAGSSITGLLAIGTVGGDGGMWRQVN